MSERKELAATIEGALDRSHGIIAWTGAAQEDIADAILAAGYRKPRTITTAEELDALAAGSVILDPIGISLHKNAFTGWGASNGAKEIPLDVLAREALPATVLYEPTA